MESRANPRKSKKKKISKQRNRRPILSSKTKAVDEDSEFVFSHESDEDADVDKVQLDERHDICGEYPRRNESDQGCQESDEVIDVNALDSDEFCSDSSDEIGKSAISAYFIILFFSFYFKHSLVLVWLTSQLSLVCPKWPQCIMRVSLACGE